MKHIKIKKVVIIIVALFGILVNVSYGIGLLKELFDPLNTNAIREIIISAVALEFGWAALLLWVIYKPIERRHILLFTAAAMFLGNVLYSVTQYQFGKGSIAGSVLNIFVGLVIAGLFVGAFFIGRPNAEE